MTDKSSTLGQGLRVSQISDALDELGLPSNAGGGYRYVGGNEPVIGRAFTVRQERVLAGSHERQAQHGDAARPSSMPAHADVASIRHRKAVARVRFMDTLERLTGTGVNGDRNPVRYTTPPRQF